MTNSFKLKSSHCIEWILSVSSTHNSRRVSESFILRNVKCNLRFEYHGHYNAYLFCESNLTLNPAIDMIVIAIASGGYYYGTTTSNTLCKRTKFTGKNVEIWNNVKHHELGTTLTFEVITHNIEISKEIGPETISGSHIPQEYKVTSYLENIAHFQALSRDFSKLLEGDSSSNVVIICDKSKFHAHKIILESRSSVFSAMLKSDMVEGKTGVINVRDITSSIFESFLRYLYSGMLPKLSIQTAKELYKAGDKYAVEELKKACSEFLNKNLSQGNACEILVLADLHSDTDFRKKVISYIVEKKIPQYDTNWSNFCSCHPRLAIEVLNNFIKQHCPK